jgi:hypothetical protein
MLEKHKHSLNICVWININFFIVPILYFGWHDTSAHDISAPTRPRRHVRAWYVRAITYPRIDISAHRTTLSTRPRRMIFSLYAKHICNSWKLNSTIQLFNNWSFNYSLSLFMRLHRGVSGSRNSNLILVFFNFFMEKFFYTKDHFFTKNIFFIRVDRKVIGLDESESVITF